MSGDQLVTPPPVLWAQRANVIYLTVCLEDCKDPIIKVEPETVFFSGVGGTEKKKHELTIYLYNKIDPALSKTSIMDRTIELVLKKVDGVFWPRLTKDKNKFHWLKVNFTKWKDEDDSSSDVEEQDNLEDMMSCMDGLGPNKKGFDDDDEEEEEEIESDGELPDLE